MLWKLVVLTPIAITIATQRWVAAGDQLISRYKLVLWTGAVLAGLAVLVAYGVDTKKGNDVLLFSIPTFVAVCGVIGLGALAVKHPLANMPWTSQAVVLGIGSVVGGYLLFAFTCLLGMALMWKTS